MRWVVKAIATVGCVGYVPKAPGTAGSVVGLLVGWLWPWPGLSFVNLVTIGSATCLGAFVSTVTEQDLRRHDPPCVVIDEVVGMWATMILRPFAVLPIDVRPYPREILLHVLVVPVAFLLFRLFDIMKPPPLKRLARLPGGWGIMADDLGATFYAGLALWAVWLSVADLSGSATWWLIHR